jgi:predicted Zn-dependent peptidase
VEAGAAGPVAGAIAAEGPAAAAPADDPPAVRRTELPNGLTVLSEQVPGARSVAFGAWVRSGTVHERREEMGISHLLEHMVFKGTRRRSAREIALSLEVLGGSLDAYTEREHTSYQARVLGEHLPRAAEVIGELLFEPLLRDEDLRLERQVILEEIGMVEDTPDDLIFDLHGEALWGDHPHGFPILGTRETVGALSVEAVQALHARAYRPGRIVVVAAGRVEHDRLLEVLSATGWTARIGGGGAAAVVPPAVARPPQAVHAGRRDLAQTHVVLGGPAIAHGDPRRWAFALLETVLGGGMASRLFQRVREELGLAYSVHTFRHSHADTGVHGVYLASAPATAQRALDAVRAELDAVVRDGLPDAELEAGRQQLRGQVVLSLEGVSSRLHRAATSALYHEPVETVGRMLAAVDAIDAATVHEVARTFFDPARLTLVSHGPRAVR